MAKMMPAERENASRVPKSMLTFSFGGLLALNMFPSLLFLARYSLKQKLEPQFILVTDALKMISVLLEGAPMESTIYKQII